MPLPPVLVMRLHKMSKLLRTLIEIKSSIIFGLFGIRNKKKAAGL